MSGLLVTCRTCGRDYEPTRREIIAGYAIWSYCPRCRGSPPVAATDTEANQPTKGDEQ